MYNLTHAEDTEDQRKFNKLILPNGMTFIFVHDPSMESVAVQLNIKAGYSKDPAGLSGLAQISNSSLGRGSISYPGLENFATFIEENEVTFRTDTTFDTNQVIAEVPDYVFEEYLDRLSDMLTSPDISKETLKHTELRYGQAYYARLNAGNFREAQVMSYLFFGKLYQHSLLFTRKDLVARVREFIDYYFRPSNMTVFILGSISLECMWEGAVNYFSNLTNKHAAVFPRGLFGPPDARIDFAESMRKRGRAVIAWTHSRTQDRRLNVSFRLPSRTDQSSPLYVAYLLNRSQPGSLHYRLKSLGLIKDLFTEHVAYSTNFEILRIRFRPTIYGSRNIPSIMSYLMGYIEELKKMHPNYLLFNQAKEYFSCINALNNPLANLDRYIGEILMGGEIHELLDANIPTQCNPGNIRQVILALCPSNCHIVAMSSDHVETTVHPETDFFLQFSVENLEVEPRFDGIAMPQVDDLIISSRRLAVPTLDLNMICKSPIVYQQSISNEIYTFLNIGIRSRAFESFSPTTQRIYAALLNHKMSLVTLRNICEVNFGVVEKSLHIFVKSFPGTLQSLINLLVEYMATPLTSEFQDKFLELKKEEENSMCRWLSDDTRIKYEPVFEKLLYHNVDVNKDLLELKSVQYLCELPDSINGDLVLLFGGSINHDLSQSVILKLKCLHRSDCFDFNNKGIEGDSTAILEPDPSHCGYYESDLSCGTVLGDLRKTISRDQGLHSSVVKVFSLGQFSHLTWGVSLTVTSMVKNVLLKTMRGCDLFGSQLYMETIRKNGWIWLVVECTGISSVKNLEDMILRFVSENLAELLLYADENWIYESQIAVLKKCIAVRQSSEQEMNRIWESIWPNPYDVDFFETMQEVLWSLSPQLLREFYEMYLSRSRQFGTDTVILKSCEGSTYLPSIVADLELDMMGIYVPVAEREQKSPFCADRRPEEYTSPRQKLNYWRNLLSEFT